MVINLRVLDFQTMSNVFLYLLDFRFAILCAPYAFILSDEISAQPLNWELIRIYQSSGGALLLSFDKHKLIMPCDHIDFMEHIVHLLKQICLSHDEVLILIQIINVVINLLHYFLLFVLIWERLYATLEVRHQSLS